jgi:hypothetical protein
VTLIDELPDQVPLSDVRGLVGHYSGQLIFIARGQDQAALDRDETSRHREGIDDGILQHEVVELMLAFFSTARQAVSDLLNVIAHLGIFEDYSGLAHAAEPTETRLIFVVERHGRGGRASKVRQVLVHRARTRAHARCPAHTDDCAGPGGRGKRRKGLQQ